MEVKRIVHGDIKAYFKVLTDSLLSDYNAAMQAVGIQSVLKRLATSPHAQANKWNHPNPHYWNNHEARF